MKRARGNLDSPFFAPDTGPLQGMGAAGLARALAQRADGPSVEAPGFPLSFYLAVGVLAIAAALIVGANARRRRRSAETGDALRRLVAERNFEWVASADRRAELAGPTALAMMSLADFPLEVREAVTREEEGFTLSVVRPAFSGRNGDPAHAEADTPSHHQLAVVCDRLGATLPQFDLQPENHLLRWTEGEGLYRRGTPFGFYNHVSGTDEPKRVRHLLGKRVQDLLAHDHHLAMASRHSALVIFPHERSIPGEEVPAFIDQAKQIAATIRKNIPSMPAEEPAQDEKARPSAPR
jgi:hypothetical protein